MNSPFTLPGLEHLQPSGSTPRGGSGEREDRGPEGDRATASRGGPGPEQLLEGLDLRDAQNELVLRGAKKNAVKQAALRLKKLFTEDEE